MKKNIRRFFTLVIVFSLVLSFSSLSFAKNAKNKHFKFTDIGNHWAMDSIERLSSLGLVDGYGDGTFQPNKPVTRLQAVAFIVKTMGYLNEEDTNFSSYDLPYHDSNQIPAWSVPYLAVAIEHGLIAESSRNFQPNKGATRLEVISMISKALEDKNTLYEQLSLNLEDIADLPNDDLLNIKMIVSKGIITGYKNNTFQPNKPITRAEMAIIMNRLLQHIENQVKNQIIKATFVELSNDIISVQPLNTNRINEYSLSDDVRVYQQINETQKVEIDLEDLKSNDELELILNKDKEVLIINVTKTVEIIEQEGAVRDVDVNTNKIKIRTIEDNSLLYSWYTVSNGAVITKGSLNTPIGLENISIGDTVQFKVNEQNEIYSLHVLTNDDDPIAIIGLDKIKSFTLIKSQLEAKLVINSYNEVQIAYVKDGTTTYTGNTALSKIKSLIDQGHLISEFNLDNILSLYQLSEENAYKVEFVHDDLGKVVVTKSDSDDSVHMQVVKDNFSFNYELSTSKEELKLIDTALNYNADVMVMLNDNQVSDVLGVIQTDSQTVTFNEDSENLQDYINDITDYLSAKDIILSLYLQ